MAILEEYPSISQGGEQMNTRQFYMLQFSYLLGSSIIEVGYAFSSIREYKNHSEIKLLYRFLGLSPVVLGGVS